MNQEIIQKLKEWRVKKAREENVELFRIFQNKTLEDFAALLPRNKDELLAIKGIRERKFQKYGQEVLSIIAECIGDPEIKRDLKVDETLSVKEKIYSVSNFLDLVNFNLTKIQVGIKGEVSSVDFKKHAYFSMKDKNDGSVVNCLMWSDDYQMSGIDLKEGMEIIVRGYAEIYKPVGKFTFRVSYIELVGEGALKKAYDALKKKLTAEGLFAIERKKPMPALPRKIGLITSKTGAVIHDFQSNLGRFGYEIKFYDSRVEGSQAVKDLINAIRYFKNKPIDVLVVIRGGGSLESLQAFNNEVLIREIIDYPIPIICGIGHDKDVPLFSLAADKAESTPSFVAREINRTWEQSVDKLKSYEALFINNYSSVVNNTMNKIDNHISKLKNNYQSIFHRISEVRQTVKNALNILKQNIANSKSKLKESTKMIVVNYLDNISQTTDRINNNIKLLQQNDPNRQLKLGYSIIFSNNKVIKSIKQVKKDDILKSRLIDGEITSIIKSLE